jgi:O-acetyl-ADP-ribose deacetylase (regulator of RNase III)
MIRNASGNLLEAKAEALVNTVNTVGIMGKGIALQFKQAFPNNFKLYKKACAAGEIQVGQVFVTQTQQLQGPRFIVNFPTKTHWRANSKLTDIETGLIALRKWIEQTGIQSIAVPPLGCGNGGLDWEVVRPLIEKHLDNLNAQVLVYGPQSNIYEHLKLEARADSKLTIAKAQFIQAAKQYGALMDDFTHLEAQKLAYFLKRVGSKEITNTFIQHHYGPYAEGLRHWFEEMNGAYLIGFTLNESSPYQLLAVNQERLDEVQRYWKENATEDEKQTLNNLFAVIDGFETPYAMELIASADWVLDHNPRFVKSGDSVTDEDLTDLVNELHNWNDRKRQTLKAEHIRIAYIHLLKHRGILYPNVPA